MKPELLYNANESMVSIDDRYDPLVKEQHYHPNIHNGPSEYSDKEIVDALHNILHNPNYTYLHRNLKYY
jgi:hypothetical protein